MVTKGIYHPETGTALEKTEYEAEASHELASGTEFPGAPTEKELFYRTDEHKWYVWTGSEWRELTWVSKTAGITYSMDNGDTVIPTGVWGYLRIPFACTVKAWTLIAKQSGSIVIDIWKDTYANFPPTDADAMPGSGKEPTLSSAQIGEDTDITDWAATSISAGDILAFNVDSCTDIKQITLTLKAEKA